MALFPEWVPTEPLLVFFVVFVVGVALVNRERSWVTNALHVNEPLVIALGVLIAAMNRSFVDQVGGEPMWYIGLGGVVSLYGLYTWRMDK